MATLSGKWTIKAIKINAGWQQGIKISGSNAHDGIRALLVGDVIQGVEGIAIQVRPQAFNPNSHQWIASREKTQYEWDDKVGMTLTIFADDNPPAGDLDYNDLVVVCIAEDADLTSPHAGLPGPDLTIPKSKVGAGGK